MFLTDSHCHLDQLDYCSIHKNTSDVLKKATTRDVLLFLTVAVTLENYKKKVSTIKHDRVFHSCGVHPLYTNNTYSFSDLLTLSSSKKVIAIGETGLDYFHSKQKIQQQKSFCKHILVARQLKKPVIVHNRNANQDTISFLKKEQAIDCGGILHCFTGTKDTAKKALDLGFYISFSGIVTFKNSYDLREILRYIPLNKLLLETDCPYLSPVPNRNKENHPAFLRDIAEYIAFLKEIKVELLAEETTKNFSRLFKININKNILLRV